MKPYIFFCLDFRQKSNAPRRMSKIVWIDMEMTGLNLRNDRIMEIACLITDNSLNVVAEHPTIVINQPDSLLDSMNEWCTTTHTKVNRSNVSFYQAYQYLFVFLERNELYNPQTYVYNITYVTSHYSCWKDNFCKASRF